MLKTVRNTSIFLVVSGIFLGTIVFYWLSAKFTQPLEIENSKIIEIENGMSLQDIAKILEINEIIPNSLIFMFGTRLQGTAGKLKAGEYEFAGFVTPKQTMEKLVRGETLNHTITLPEGLTTSEVLKRLRQDQTLRGELPDVVPEGVLLPETYTFKKGYSRERLIYDSLRALDAFVQSHWDSKTLRFPLSFREVIILASIVEKETKLPRERAIVASVYLNRLKRGMPLQSDPSVAYGLTVSQGREYNTGLSKQDLRTDTLYNTYLRKGLPPTPICNPGKASILAVLHPAETNFLYFVADGTGGHVFAATGAEHQRNHAKWRKIRDAQQEQTEFTTEK